MLGIEQLLARSASSQRDLVCAMIVARILRPSSKLALAGGLDLDTVPVDDPAQWTMLANVGDSYMLTDSVQASVGRTLRDTDRGGSEVLLQTFVQWNFD